LGPLEAFGASPAGFCIVRLRRAVYQIIRLCRVVDQNRPARPAE